ncbi:MAG: hypothetical protein M1817_005059 [Caeruleum heppii]|nr:MAG: hypothetical protein M1817_005059 [Caeruleum heppii]
MGRRKIEIKAIKDDRNRSVTFLKRKGGLFKKAHELSVLCSVDVAVIIFGHNKKLYEFSSGDINDIIGRYQYYGAAHEHKGPADFNGRKDMDDDDDDEMASPPPESHSSQDHPVLSHPIHEQAAYQHIRHHTPSASPPIPNGVPFRGHGTPQPQGGSRPSSRTAVRHPGSNLVPQHHSHAPHAPHTSPPQNGYAYMAQGPPLFNPQAGAGMPMQPATSQQPQYQYPPQTAPLPPAQHAYLQDQHRRSSMPPAFPQERPPPPHETSPPRPQRATESQGMLEPKRAPVKSKSIFTPVDEGRSILAQVWGMGTTASEQSRHDQSTKNEGARSQSIDVGSVSRASHPSYPAAPPPRPAKPPSPPRTSSISSQVDIPPPSRTNSGILATAQGAKRPRLKVQIPDEPSDGGSATADSSPRNSGGTAGGGPSTKTGTEGSHSSGVVLPPPSPSASALLSAGATGPPNPFARPNPPSSAAPNNNIETPISALPSRFMADGFLPSPSSFYPEWGFGRAGGDSNMLPSPLNFQTPVGSNGPSFLRDEPVATKRKSPEGENTEAGANKRLKA